MYLIKNDNNKRTVFFLHGNMQAIFWLNYCYSKGNQVLLTNQRETNPLSLEEMFSAFSLISFSDGKQ